MHCPDPVYRVPEEVGVPGNAYLRPAAALVGSALIQDKAPRPKDSETSANRLPPACIVPG